MTERMFRTLLVSPLD